MANTFEVGAKIPFSFMGSLGNFFDRKNEIKILLSHALFSSKLSMEQKVYRRISDNIYQTLQEHKKASRELQKTQLKKGKTLFEKLQNSKNEQIPFSKNIFQLN
jgi:hypothetical protein